jgi:hypothetical protein
MGNHRTGVSRCSILISLFGITEMNERLKELLLKAGWDGYEALDERNQKFAELIVRECISIVEAQKESLCENELAWSHDDYGYERAVNDSVDMVKKHFGVEE